MWERKSVLLLVLATVAILVGTVVTMVMPFAWVNTDSDSISGVKPYSAIELAGRDVYVREGCNNCHSQTVRPLEADVKRYGEYSRSGEFVYDRPFLWGSRRMGPDLARIGGKYGDDWHYKHMENPSSMVTKTNMPSYTFLNDSKVDPEFTRKKMQVLGFPYTDAEIKALDGKSDMDAIIAYMQKLGTDLPDTYRAAVSAKGLRKSDVNPLAGNPEAIEEGEEIYEASCASCHGEHREGCIGPELPADTYGDAELFDVISGGVSGGGMPAFTNLGSDRIWKVVAFIQSGED